MKSKRLLMMGAGRMAEAILAGLVENSSPSFSITVTNQKDKARLQELANKYDVITTTNWNNCVEEMDLIILAAPPSVHNELLKELSPHLTNQLIITVAAGIDPTFMESRLPIGTPVCWVMPNTSAQVQKSMTTYVCGQYVKAEHREPIRKILDAIGSHEELSEDQVHDLTAITGSSPAFLYLFCEALENAAISYGISSDQARKLVTKMVSGTAAMLETGQAPEELRAQVTSPGGSTAAGVDVLLKHQYEDIIQEAVTATNAHARSQS